MATLPQLVAYIRQYKDRYSVAALKSQLMRQNIPEAEIDQAIRMATTATPVSRPPVPGPSPTPAPAQPTAPIGATSPARSYILCVDNDSMILDMMVTKLEGAGYRVTSAEDAAQQVVQAEGMRLSLIISDIEMPGFGTGVDALKKLRASNMVRRNLPVIFLTGMPPNEAKKLMPKNDPYVRLLHKPVDWKLLRQYIKDLTGMDNPLD